MAKRFGGLALTFKADDSANPIDDACFYVGDTLVQVCESRTNSVQLRFEPAGQKAFVRVVQFGTAVQYGQTQINLVESKPSSVRLNILAPASVIIDRKSVRADKVKAASDRQLAEVASRK